MARLSTIDRLPVDQRDLIRRLRSVEGRTIREIVEHMRRLSVPVSKSAIGRHIKALDLADERGLAAELLRQRKAINGLTRRIAALSAAIDRLEQRKEKA